jgi:hypothetical protein
MLRSLAARLRRLEAQTLGTEEARGQGLSGLLAYARTHHIEAVPLTSLTDAELDAQIADLTAQVAAGARGYPRLLLEALELYRQPAPTQDAQAREPLT